MFVSGRARVWHFVFFLARFHTTATVPPVQASFWPRPPRHQPARGTRAGPPRGSLARPLPSQSDAERTTPTAASAGPGDELNRQTRATRNRTAARRQERWTGRCSCAVRTLKSFRFHARAFRFRVSARVNRAYRF